MSVDALVPRAHGGGGRIRAGPWQPLLSERADEVRAAIDVLATELLIAPDYNSGWEEQPRNDDQYGVFLSSGRPGLALAYGYLGRVETAERLLEETTEGLPRIDLHPTLYVGVVGAGWVLAHLTRTGIAERFSGDWTAAFTDLDELLVAYTARTPWQSDFDLVKGLVGLGVYALERHPEPVAAECLESVVRHIAATAEHSTEGVTWFTPPEFMDRDSQRRFRDGYYDLGLAHGVAGVLAFLASAYAVVGDRGAVEELLARGSQWLLRRRGEGRFPYPREMGRDGDVESGRLSWCNGNIGIAAALLKTGLVLDDQRLQAEAIDLALQTSAVDAKHAHILDACLCHGAAGIAHVLGRMFHATGDERLRDRALDWYGVTLGMREPGTGIGGYLFGNPAAGDGFRDPGFLMGGAGLLLALVAAVDPREPEWDRVMLLDMPVREDS